MFLQAIIEVIYHTLENCKSFDRNGNIFIFQTLWNK